MNREGHSCVLEWGAKWPDVSNALIPLLSTQEKEAMKSITPMKSESVYKTLKRLSHEFETHHCPRRPIALESLGDFWHLLLVPRPLVDQLEKAGGGWLIIQS